jgi:hypothetical protein
MPVAERQQETETDVGWLLRRWSRITGRIRAGARPERGLTWSGEPDDEVNETSEPEGKLDAASVVNGPRAAARSGRMTMEPTDPDGLA